MDNVKQAIKEELMTYEMVAEFLAVSVQTVRSYVAQKHNPLPVYYISRQNPRVFKSELIEWIKSSSSRG